MGSKRQARTQPLHKGGYIVDGGNSYESMGIMKLTAHLGGLGHAPPENFDCFWGTLALK